MVEFQRDGKKVWPYCSACGCRLAITDNKDGRSVLGHFLGNLDKDARGCRCSFVPFLQFVETSRISEFT